MFRQSVNTAFINKTLMRARIPPMHESVGRLLDFARKATKGTPEEVADLNGLTKRMNVSPQMMNNWKGRGISKDGALDAERLFGCSATWLLTGDKPPKVGSSPLPELVQELVDHLLAIEDPTALAAAVASAWVGVGVYEDRVARRDSKPTRKHARGQ